MTTLQEQSIKDAMFHHKSEKNKRSKVTVHGNATDIEPGKKQSNSYYPLFGKDRKEIDEKARMAIADFILSCGLPFRIADHPKFWYMCESIRITSNPHPPL